MAILEGKYTLETFARKNHFTRGYAVKKLCLMRKKGLVEESGGGRQKKIYTISKVPFRKGIGFYDIVNRYAPDKLVPKFDHIAYGKYGVEHAIIDGIRIGDVRTLEATMHLFNHVKDWKGLFELARKDNAVDEVKKLYSKARESIRVRKMPERYLR